MQIQPVSLLNTGRPTGCTLTKLVEPLESSGCRVLENRLRHSSTRAFRSPSLVSYPRGPTDDLWSLVALPFQSSFRESLTLMKVFLCPVSCSEIMFSNPQFRSLTHYILDSYTGVIPIAGSGVVPLVPRSSNLERLKYGYERRRLETFFSLFVRVPLINTSI